MRGVLADKHILITGGSSGIGLAMAHLFALEGAAITLLARDPDRLARAADSLAAHRVPVQTYACDVTQPRRLHSAIGEASASAGGLHGVVANSGYCHPGRFHEMHIEDATRQIATNMTGAVLTLQSAIPHLIQAGGGFLALTSSPAGSAGIFGFNIYGATKAALNNLAHALRHEYRLENIRVHLLLPPDTETPGYAREIMMYPAETRAILSGGRVYPPEIVAEKFVRGILRGKQRVTVGFETRLVLAAVRHFPWLWEAYTRMQIRRARRNAEP